VALDYGMRVVHFRPGIGEIYERDLISAHATTPATAGTFTITVDGQTTAGIAFDALPSAVQSALEALSNVAPGDVACSMLSGTDLGDAGAVLVIVWGGAFAGVDPVVTANFAGLTGNPHTFEARLRQVIRIPSGYGADKTILAARFRMGGAAALDTIEATARMFLGVADATSQFSLSSSAEDNVLPSSANAGYQVDTDSVLRTPTGHCSRIEFATGDGSVEVSWRGTLPNLRASVALWFGDDLEAKVGTVAGSSTQDASVDFDPDFANDPVLVEVFSVGQAFSANGSGNEAMISAGSAGRASSTITSSCFVVCAEHQQSPSSSGLVGVSGRSAVRLTSNGGTVTQGAGLEVTKMLAGELEFTTRDAAESLSAMFLVVAVPGGVRGVSIAETQAVGTTGVKNFDSVGFLPMACGVASGRTASVGTVGSGQGNLSYGAADGTSQGCSGWRARDNQTSSTETQSITSETRLVDVLDGDAAHDWIGVFDGFTEDGFDVDVTDAAGGSRVVCYWALEKLVRVDPDPVELDLVLPAPAILVELDPTPVGLPLVLPAPALLATLTPAPVDLALALPAPQLLSTETPAPVELPLVLPAPALLVTLTPAPVELALVLPAPALLVELEPDPVDLALVLPAPQLLATETPAPIELELVLPAPTVLEAGEQSPFPVELDLVLPAPALLVTLTPAPVELALVLPAPALLVELEPDPVDLALVLPAPQLLVSETPAPVELVLVLPAPTLILAEAETPAPVELALALPPPARLLELTPAAAVLSLVVPATQVLGVLTPASVELALVVPSPFLGRRVGIELVAEVHRSASATAETARDLSLVAPTPRALELAASLE